jgi:hypothetical protein
VTLLASLIVASLIVAAAVAWAAQHVVAQLRAARDEEARGRTATLLALFAPAMAAAQAEPRAYLVWQPIAKMTRQLFPFESAALDRAAGVTFPFTPEQIQAAHAQWTADWLAWERSHDAEYKLKAAVVLEAVASAPDTAVARGQIDAVEREKLDLYQRRYAEYVRIAKALQALLR